MRECASLPEDCPFRIRQDVCWLVKVGDKRPVKAQGWIVDAYIGEKKTRHNKVGWILLIKKGNNYIEKRLNEVTLL